MLPEPSEVSRHVWVSVRYRLDHWDGALPSQKLDKMLSASPPPLRA
jgi:hypothetical protein